MLGMLGFNFRLQKGEQINNLLIIYRMLHRGLAHKRSTLTSILDRLADRGLITREIGKTDRRTFLISLTAKGRKMAHRVNRHLSDLERGVMRRVTGVDIKGFTNVVAALEQEAHSRTRARR
jgi:DNA-binding MarR family transcriptional regulator